MRNHAHRLRVVRSEDIDTSAEAIAERMANYTRNELAVDALGLRSGAKATKETTDMSPL